MGTIPAIDNLRVACSDGSLVFISIDTTTSDIADSGHGSVYLHGRFDDGRDFGFPVLLSVYSDQWLRRLCDAVAAHVAFRESLVDIEEVGDSFIVPSAPARETGAVERLARLGNTAKFADFMKLRSGRDRFSAMKMPDLIAAAGPGPVGHVRQHLAGLPQAQQDADTAKALRWVLRGLPAAMAVRKVKVDNEISQNAIGGHRRR